MIINEQKSTESIGKMEEPVKLSRKRKLEKSVSSKSKDHVADPKSFNKITENAKKRGLKRKHSSVNAIPKISSLPIRKKKANNSNKNTDTLNLEDLSKEHILQCISAIFHLTEEQLKEKNALFHGENHSIFMQVTCIRVPKTPRRHMRILLPHSIVSEDEDVALFVGDLERGRRQDNDITMEHYQELLEKNGCNNIKSVINLNQVKTEYDQYELKRKLVGSYDHFLVDGKIAGHLSHLLGKEFQKKRKMPTSIRMQSKDLKHEIEYALRKTSMQLHSHGDTHIVQIGNTSMKEEQILDNVLATCAFLSKNYPGGWNNIRSIRIKSPKSLALPIYTSLRSKNTVNIPVIEPKRPKAYRNVSGELSTFVRDTEVTVTPEGDVIVKKKKSQPKAH